MSIINYHDATVINMNLDDNGREVSIPITNEIKQVVDGKIPLEGLPDEQFRIQITGYVEINVKDKIDSPEKFKCDYIHGVLYFDQSKNGANININKYYSRGQFYIPSSRIWTKVDDLGNVVSTLADMEGDIGAMASQIDAINNMAENASGIATSLETNVSKGTILNTNLGAKIVTATSKNEALDYSISNSNTAKSNLDTSISNSQTAKTNLDGSVTTANTTKSELSAIVGTANTLNSDLAGKISTGNILKNDLSTNITEGYSTNLVLTPLVDLAQSKKESLDGSVSIATSKITEVNSAVDGANAVKSELNTSITNANTINNTLSNVNSGTIKVANTAKSALDDSIATSQISMDNLDSSIDESVVAKSGLDTSNSTAIETKNNLDGSIVSGNTLKGELDTIISGTNYEAINIDISNLQTNKANITYVDNELLKKVDKVTGKQLSTEDFSTLEKAKLTNIATEATKNDTDANLKTRANHTGTQIASTISDFAGTVRATILTGLSTATNAVVSGTDTVLISIGKLQKQITDNLAILTGHTGNASNPHSVTKTQVGLGNIDNTSDMDKPISNTVQQVLDNKADILDIPTKISQLESDVVSWGKFMGM